MIKRKAQASGRQRLNQNIPRNAGVFSYYAARSRRPDNVGRDTSQDNALDSRDEAQKRTRRSKRLITALVVIVLVGLSFNAMLVTPEPTIAVVGDQTNQAFLQPKSVYRDAAAELIKTSLLNRNKITFDAAAVSRALRERFAELDGVSVSQPLLGHKPVVHIQAFTPKLILVSGTSTFVLSSEGRAFLPGSQVPALERFKLPVVRDQSGLTAAEGAIVLPQREVAFIAEVNRQLAAKKISVTGYNLPPGGSELEVRIKDKPHIVRFNLYGNAREGAGRYLAARDYLQRRGEVPGRYIDARVDNHIYLR